MQIYSVRIHLCDNVIYTRNSFCARKSQSCAKSTINEPRCFPLPCPGCLCRSAGMTRCSRKLVASPRSPTVPSHTGSHPLG